MKRTGSFTNNDVFCGECKHLERLPEKGVSFDTSFVCNHPENYVTVIKKDWYEKQIKSVKLLPTKRNLHNNCSLFEIKD